MLIVVRHGETDWNRSRRLQGHTDIGLNATGRLQAERIAAHLAARLAAHAGAEAIVAVHTSDLARARDTARPVAAALGLVAQETPLLRERNYGLFEGLTFEELIRRYPLDAQRLQARDSSYAMPGGESARAFYTRVVAAVGSIALNEAAKDKERCVLIVTHGGVLDMLYRAANGLPLDAERRCAIPNAALNRVSFHDGRFAVLEWADDGHLDGI